MSRKINIALLFPCDPVEPFIGGVDSFIRGMIANAPENIEYTVIGATTNRQKRPMMRWSECRLEDKTYRFFPIIATPDRGKRSKIPTTVRYELAALFRMPSLKFADVIESHRIEHLLWHGKGKPINLFIHLDMADLYNPKSDILWKSNPKLYRFLERRVLNKLGLVYCIRENAVEEYQHLYPAQTNKFRFQPTWMDENVFFPVPKQHAQVYRLDLCHEFGFDPHLPLAIAVGRLDTQKDPALMVEALAKVVAQGKTLQLLWIGEGVLRKALEQFIRQYRLERLFKLAGLKDAPFIANALRGSDFFVMSSAIEGMPIALLEAFACGCPAVSTAVGEVPKLLQDGANGFLAQPGDVNGLCQAIISMLENFTRCAGKPCTDVAANYRAEKVLQQVYQGYQRLVN